MQWEGIHSRAIHYTVLHRKQRAVVMHVLQLWRCGCRSLCFTTSHVTDYTLSLSLDFTCSTSRFCTRWHILLSGFVLTFFRDLFTVISTFPSSVVDIVISLCTANRNIHSRPFYLKLILQKEAMIKTFHSIYFCKINMCDFFSLPYYVGLSDLFNATKYVLAESAWSGERV